jgi:hypothetical protein
MRSLWPSARPSARSARCGPTNSGHNHRAVQRTRPFCGGTSRAARRTASSYEGRCHDALWTSGGSGGPGGTDSDACRQRGARARWRVERVLWRPTRSLRTLEPGGRYLLVGFSGGLGRIARALVTGGFVHLWGRARFVTGAADPKQADLVFLQELIDAGKLRTVIGRRYRLDEIAEAHRYARYRSQDWQRRGADRRSGLTPDVCLHTICSCQISTLARSTVS